MSKSIRIKYIVQFCLAFGGIFFSLNGGIRGFGAAVLALLATEFIWRAFSKPKS